MVKYAAIIVILAIVTFVRCDWIEIPQTMGTDKEKITKKTDFTTYMLTTTSTTTQTPIFAKPVILRRNATKTFHKTNKNISTSTIQSHVLPKPLQSNKKVINNNNINKHSNDVSSATIKPSEHEQINSGNKNSPVLSNNRKHSTTSANVNKTTNIRKNLGTTTLNNTKISETTDTNAEHTNNTKTTPVINTNTNETIDTNAANKLKNLSESHIMSINESKLDEVTDYDEVDELEEVAEYEEQEGDNNFSYANFIPYMSAIQTDLMKNAHKNKRSKLNVLKDLRDHLLNEIYNRVSTLWSSKSEGRGAREYKEETHMDFPSNEGALMTIGFLTFGVFLIKLVMQLIQTIGNKVQSDDGTTTTTTIIGRKRRGIDVNEAIKILNYIEQFRLK